MVLLDGKSINKSHVAQCRSLAILWKKYCCIWYSLNQNCFVLIMCQVLCWIHNMLSISFTN